MGIEMYQLMFKKIWACPRRAKAATRSGCAGLRFAPVRATRTGYASLSIPHCKLKIEMEIK